MKVLIIGTGYVGLNTGVALAFLGHKVTCLDIEESKISLLQQGKVPIYEPHLETLLALSKNNLKFTMNYDTAEIKNTDVVFICVGTPSLPNGQANLNYVRAAAEAIGERINDHFTVIVNKSTVPIGSGNWVNSIIRDAFINTHGQKADKNYAIASNPEFLRQGSALYDTLYPDRIVIGSEDTRAIDLLTNLYRPLLNQDFPAPDCLPRPEGLGAVPIVTCDLASAELIKYAANSFLALKISYINEISKLASKVGADISQIAKGIGLDSRIGPRFLKPGLGWGGSCFGKDTAALIATAQEYNLEMPIIQSAREVNYRLRDYVVEKLQEELKILKGRTITILGLAFKPNTDDLRDAPSIDIIKKLIERGAKIRAHDPVAMDNFKYQFPDLHVDYFTDASEAVIDSDGIVLVTEWPEYRNLNWSSLSTTAILDGRNFLNLDK